MVVSGKGREYAWENYKGGGELNRPSICENIPSFAVIIILPGHWISNTRLLQISPKIETELLRSAYYNNRQNPLLPVQ